MESDLFEKNVEVDHLVCNTHPQVQDKHISPQTTHQNIGQIRHRSLGK